METINIRLGNERFDNIKKLSEYYYSPEFEEKYDYPEHNLGARCTPRGTTWRIWAPAAEKVQLRLYKTGSDTEEGSQCLGEYDMLPDQKHPGVFKLSLTGKYHGIYYTYMVSISGWRQETADIYAKACGVNGLRSMVVDLSKTDPSGWNKDNYQFQGKATDAVLWETHVRDFSFSRSSGMKHKGKFLAFTESGTTVNADGEHETGVDYLKKLGITHVHLMPVFDFATVDESDPNREQYNWGYDPLNFNCPEGSYSTDPFRGEVRIREMKQMILALHKAGIGVIMDVVYNHTYRTKDSFQHLSMPYYYHRTMPDGTFGNASGCGNEIASERIMARRYILDSIRYWAEEYHVDGFRFDLMGILDVETVKQIRTMLDEMSKGKNYLMYGEPWYALQPTMPKGVHPADMAHIKELADGVAVFSDATRDAIKGSAFDRYDRGFINGALGFERRIKGAIKGQVDGDIVKDPTRIITYASSHDNYTLWDKIALTSCGDGSGFDDPEMLRLAENKLAAAIVLTSQGIPFFQSGEEFGRSKYSIENSYNSDSRINELRWQRTISFKELTDYYKGLLKIRSLFSPLRDSTPLSAMNMCFCSSDNQTVAYTIPGKRKGEPKMMAICFNAAEEGHVVELKSPSKELELPRQWEILANETSAGTTPLSEVEGTKLFVYLRGVLIAASKERID